MQGIVQIFGRCRINGKDAFLSVITSTLVHFGCGFPFHFAVAEKRAQWVWTGFILCFFGLQAVLWTVAISLTANDPSNPVIADYEHRAVTWDEDAAAQRASHQLGWQVDVSSTDLEQLTGEQQLTIRLHDREGQLVDPAVLELTAFHLAAAGRPQTVRFRSVEPGTYEGTLQVQRSGRWKLEGTIRSEESLYLMDRLINLTSTLDRLSERLPEQD